MDLSALIFVALAVAWAVYLIPKALSHHEDVGRSRSVDRFSHTMRVLARREPVDRHNARLVVTPGRPAATAEVVEVVETVAEPTAEPKPTQRKNAARAAKRRLRVVCLILLGVATVGTLAGLQIVHWGYVGIPVGVLLTWLIACRLMVKRERADLAPRHATVSAEDDVDEAPVEVEVTDGPITEEIAVVEPAPTPNAPGVWDPVPVTLPTYVGKEQAAPRTVRTIDLDDTGVWSSGRNQADSQLARDAEEADRASKRARAERDEARRAAGS